MARLGWLVAIASLGCGYVETVDPVGPPADEPYVPPPETCDAADLDDPEAFPPCSLGSGVFGTWIVDERGGPAYFYGLDQHADDRALFFNTEGLERRDHWAAFGNHRVNAMFANDGFVEVVTQDRGVTYLNKVDVDANALGGGFSYVDDGDVAWSTAYRLRPPGSVTTRRFGLGYAETSTRHRDVTVTRRLCAPPGDAPLVVDDVSIVNDGPAPRSIRHYEYWDVARRPIEINWTVSGLPLTLAPSSAREIRDGRNARFDEAPVLDASSRTLGVRRDHAPDVAPPPPSAPDAVDAYPGDPFVAVLAGDLSGAYVDQAAFFGDGDLLLPAAVRDRAAGAPLVGTALGPVVNGLGQPHVLVARTDVALEPGERKRLRFAFGYAPMGEPFVVDEAWRDVDFDVCGAAQDEILNGPHGPRPGGTWYSQVTPMTDFPVQNNNQHAMPILAAIRMAGVDATATGIRVAPPTPFEPLVMRSALLDLETRSSGAGWVLRGRYRPVGGGERTVSVALPPRTSIQSAAVGGRAASIPGGPEAIDLSGAPKNGEMAFEIEYAAP